jgi:uncharacterized protein YciI
VPILAHARTLDRLAADPGVPRQVIDDGALLPAFTYAESNPLRLVDLDGRRSVGAQAQLLAFGRQLRQEQTPGEGLQATVPAQAKLLDAAAAVFGPVPSTAELKRAATVKKWDSRADTLGGITGLLGAKPLVEVNFQRTKNGFKFQNVKVAPTMSFKQFKVASSKK